MLHSSRRQYSSFRCYLNYKGKHVKCRVQRKEFSFLSAPPLLFISNTKVSRSITKHHSAISLLLNRVMLSISTLLHFLDTIYTYSAFDSWPFHPNGFSFPQLLFPGFIQLCNDFLRFLCENPRSCFTVLLKVLCIIHKASKVCAQF